MANDFVSVSRLRIEVEALLREYPELADDDVALLDTLEGETDLLGVLAMLGRALDDTKALGEGVHARINELVAREGRFNARYELIRDLIFKVMESAQLRKVELPEVTFSLRSNPPRLVGDADPVTVPDELCKFTRSLNRKAIREAIESGHTVEGFLLSNAAPSLVVRVK
jgi:hypothetical protein